VATFNNDTGQFQFDLDRNGSSDDTLTFGFPGFGEKPIAGDFNLDGIDNIGLGVPGQEGQLPKHAGEWHLLLSDNDRIVSLPSAIFDAFSPAPLGNDLFAQFGAAPRDSRSIYRVPIPVKYTVLANFDGLAGRSGCSDFSRSSAEIGAIGPPKSKSNTGHAGYLACSPSDEIPGATD
jgi:hypothetical protein